MDSIISHLLIYFLQRLTIYTCKSNMCLATTMHLVHNSSDSKESTRIVGSLGWEDPLEEGMATHSIILAWKIPWTEEPGELQTTRSQTVNRTESAGLSTAQVPNAALIL